jgi:hypothetical protein
MKNQLLVFTLFLVTAANAQTKIKDGTITGTPVLPNSSAILELESNNKGLLLPRVGLTATSTWGLAGSSTYGMTVYDTTTAITGTTGYPALSGGKGVYYWDGTGWVAVGNASGQFWSLTGNSGTNSGTNFLGTTDNHGLRFKVDNQQAGFVDSSAISGNTFLGVLAESANTSGTQNTANGASAGITNKTGSKNTFIGDSADVTTDALTNASAIGYKAKVGASNSLVLGGTGGNAVNVGIGTSIPTSTLQVNGSVATSIVEVGNDYTLQSTDYTIVDTSQNGITLTLPDPATCKGRIYVFINFADEVPANFAGYPVYNISGLQVGALPTDIGAGSGVNYGNRMTIQSTGTMWIVTGVQ